jgi:hypothetical protein
MIKCSTAAELLLVSESTIRVMLADGRLPGIVIPPVKKGGKAVYRVDETKLGEIGIQHQLQQQNDQAEEPELRLDEI